MDRNRLVLGLTFVFAAMTATVVLVAIAAVEPVLFVVAVPLGAATGLFWYQSSGRLRERVARARAEEAADGGGGGPTAGGRGGFGAGARREARRDRRRRQRWTGDAAGQDTASRSPAGLGRPEAYRRLGLEPGADEAAVRSAYRQKVKEVHPDRGGDEEAFKQLTEAYETLVE